MVLSSVRPSHGDTLGGGLGLTGGTGLTGEDGRAGRADCTGAPCMPGTSSSRLSSSRVSMSKSCLYEWWTHTEHANVGLQQKRCIYIRVLGNSHLSVERGLCEVLYNRKRNVSPELQYIAAPSFHMNNSSENHCPFPFFTHSAGFHRNIR